MPHSRTESDLTFFAVFAIVLHYAYNALSVRWASVGVDYFLASPMAYRAESWLIIALSPYLGIAAVTALIALISLSLTWFIIRRTGEVPLLLFGVIATCLFLRLGDAPMYVFLALLAKTKRSELLIPLVLVKELAFVLGLGYLLLFKNNSKRTLVFGAISVGLYLLIRFVIIGDRQTIYPAGAVFLLPMVLAKLSTMSLTSIAFNLGTASAIVLATVQNRREVLLGLWLLVPITLFSVAWEVHHWFMLLLLLIAHRLFTLKEKDNNVTVKE